MPDAWKSFLEQGFWIFRGTMTLYIPSLQRPSPPGLAELPPRFFPSPLCAPAIKSQLFPPHFLLPSTQLTSFSSSSHPPLRPPLRWLPVRFCLAAARRKGEALPRRFCRLFPACCPAVSRASHRCRRTLAVGDRPLAIRLRPHSSERLLCFAAAVYNLCEQTTPPCSLRTTTTQH